MITVVEESSCCASYKCAPRQNLCLYNNGSNSGIEMSEHVVAKSVGEQWMNDRCTSCICELSDGGAKPKCTTMECLKAADHPDVSDFVVEEVVLRDKCCPVFERSACKDGGEVYQEGEVWQPNPEDSCTVASVCQRRGWYSQADKGAGMQVCLRPWASSTGPLITEASAAADDACQWLASLAAK